MVQMYMFLVRLLLQIFFSVYEINFVLIMILVGAQNKKKDNLIQTQSLPLLKTILPTDRVLIQIVLKVLHYVLYMQ